MSAQAPVIETKESTKQQEKWSSAGYALVLACAVALWLAGVTAPLWLDETYSWWQISAGLSKIWSRSVPTPSYGYSYALWSWQAIFGSKEWVLRIPSLLAMAAAAFVLYRCAREFFTRDVAAAVALVFIVNPIVQNEAIDVRPYAMGALVVSAAIWSQLRWTATNQVKYAVLLGLCAAGTFYFQLLLAAILPALLLAIPALARKGFQKKQFGWALAVFVAGVLPVIPGFLYVAHTAKSHSFDVSPSFAEIVWTFAPEKVLLPFLFVALAAAAFRAIPQSEENGTNFGAAILVLGFLPLGLLFFVSSMTPLHVFVPRHRIVAIPGLALCWGLLVSRISSRWLRAMFCVAVLLVAAVPVLQSPVRDWRYYSWRDALKAADAAAAPDHAPLLICSDLPEADYLPLPDNPLDSPVFAPISYYKVSAPVVGLPRNLNATAITQMDKFLASATPQHKRFVTVAFVASKPVVDELIKKTRDTYTPTVLGTYDRVQVTEFRPK